MAPVSENACQGAALTATMPGAAVGRRGLRRWAFLPWIAANLAVIVGSLVPAPLLPSIPASDKVQHSMAYLMLAFLGAASFRRRVMGLLAAVWAVLLGGVLEILQGFVAGRETDFRDFLANLRGVTLGLLCWWLVFRIVQRTCRAAEAPFSSD